MQSNVQAAKLINQVGLQLQTLKRILTVLLEYFYFASVMYSVHMPNQSG